MTTKPTFTIDQLVLAVFTEEYRVQRESFSGDRDGSIYHARLGPELATLLVITSGAVYTGATLTYGPHRFSTRKSINEDAALHWAEAQLTSHSDALALAAVIESTRT